MSSFSVAEFRQPTRPLILIPAYNEADSLPSVLAEVSALYPVSSILVIDDGSLDETAAVARKFHVNVLSLPFNLGVGGAMRAGFRFALSEGFDSVVQVDADGQHNPKDISKLINMLGEADIVIGARFAGVGNYSVGGPRKWAMIFLSRALSRICNAHLTDATSGFKALGRSALKLFATEYPVEYLGDTIEALVAASKQGLTVVQVPVAMRERLGGAPSQGVFMSSIYLMRAILALVIGLSRPRVEVKL